MRGDCSCKCLFEQDCGCMYACVYEKECVRNCHQYSHTNGIIKEHNQLTIFSSSVMTSVAKCLSKKSSTIILKVHAKSHAGLFPVNRKNVRACKEIVEMSNLIGHRCGSLEQCFSIVV